MNAEAVHQHLINLCNKQEAKRTSGQMLNQHDSLRLLITARMFTRCSIEAYLNARSELKSLNRRRKTLQAEGISFPWLDMQIKRASDRELALKKSLADWGEVPFFLLDDWQKSGATLKELCNLCNASYDKTVKMLGDKKNDSFSKIVFVHHLDYPNDGKDWIEWETDAPFTHAMREYSLDRMLNDPIRKQAAHEAMMQCFPELEGIIIYRQTGDNGAVYYVDKEGNTVDISD